MILFIFKNALAMKIQYEYEDDDNEHHSSATIILEKNDIDPTKPSMKSNYNRLGATILRGASENNRRPIYIKGIQDIHLTFVRALLQKAHEIATQREIPVSLYFYKIDGSNHNILEEEWAPSQKEIDAFYVNPYEKFLNGDFSDSDL
jgi:hypothetical protein